MASLQFPSDIAIGTQPCVGFQAMKIHSASNIAEVKTNATGDFVWLPLPPSGTSTSYQQGWEEATASVLGSGISQIASKVLGVKAEKSPAGHHGDGQETNAGTLDWSGVFGSAKDVAIEKGKGALGAGAGITARAIEQAFVSYSGPGYRQHSFSFSLRPKTKAESETIEKIIAFFKFYSAPNLRSGEFNLVRLYDTPHLFEIYFNPPIHAIKKSALTSIEVSYGGEKYNIFKDSKRPVQVDISVSLKEMEILKQDDFSLDDTKGEKP